VNSSKTHCAVDNCLITRLAYRIFLPVMVLISGKPIRRKFYFTHNTLQVCAQSLDDGDFYDDDDDVIENFIIFFPKP
jgi:hypothetical protein